MFYESFVGKRYLMSKKRSNRVVSIITIISIAGVALGVTALIVVLSVMGGFKKDLKKKILGTKAHIIIQAKDQGSLTEYSDVAKRALANEHVIGAAPFTQHEVMVSSAANLSGVMLRGIDLKRVGSVSSLPKDIKEGKLEYLIDASKMSEMLDARRDKEIDDLLDKIRKERKEYESTKADGVDPNDDVLVLPSMPLDPTIKDDIPLIVPVKPSPTPPPLIKDILTQDDLQPDTTSPTTVSLPEADDIPDLPGDLSGEVPDIISETPAQAQESEPRIAGIILGKELAKSLQVALGDEVNVVTPKGDLGPMGRLPKSQPFKVVGIFYSGMYEYDANFAYTRIEDAQEFMGVKGAKGVELKTTDVERAVEVAQELQQSLGKQYEVLDWMQMNRSLFYALKLEKIAMFVVLTFIILVASFSIIAMLIMIVIEKGREIAILKSLGASNAGIMWIFVYQGTVIGAVGTSIGLVLGLTICYLLNTVGFPLNSDVYYISKLPVELDPMEVIMIVVCSIGISILATIYPSIQAARLKPVDGLRDD